MHRVKICIFGTTLASLRNSRQIAYTINLQFEFLVPFFLHPLKNSHLYDLKIFSLFAMTSSPEAKLQSSGQSFLFDCLFACLFVCWFYWQLRIRCVAATGKKSILFASLLGEYEYYSYIYASICTMCHTICVWTWAYARSTLLQCKHRWHTAN